MKLKALLAFLTLNVLSPLTGIAEPSLQNISQEDPVDNAMNTMRRAGNYLGAISLLKHEIEKGEAEKNKWTQTLAFYYSFVGQYADAVIAMHAAWTIPPQTPVPSAIRDQFLNAITIENAKHAICQEIRKHQVVIINENHHHPQ
jgi:hypothetical protein